MKEGKIELTRRLRRPVPGGQPSGCIAVNSREDVMIATRKGNTAVKKGDKLAGMRVIPLIIAEEKLQRRRSRRRGPPLCWSCCPTCRKPPLSWPPAAR